MCSDPNLIVILNLILAEARKWCGLLDSLLIGTYSLCHVTWWCFWQIKMRRIFSFPSISIPRVRFAVVRSSWCIRCCSCIIKSLSNPILSTLPPSFRKKKGKWYLLFLIKLCLSTLLFRIPYYLPRSTCIKMNWLAHVDCEVPNQDLRRLGLSTNSTPS